MPPQTAVFSFHDLYGKFFGNADWQGAQRKRTNLVIPNKIGPYGITAITDGLFRDYCYLETVTIPAAVKSIGSDAFKGCHNLGKCNFQIL